MSFDLKGNRAVKVPSGILSQKLEMDLLTREQFIYWKMLNHCQGEVVKIASVKNIDILEYQALYNQRCSNLEKLYFNNLRSKMREKMYFDQIKDFANDYEGIYHPYNPYLQKYHGEYLKTYQLFE